MAIDIDIYTQLHDRSLQGASNNLHTWGQRTGREVGNDLSRELSNAILNGSKGVQQAAQNYKRVFDSMTSANESTTRSQRELSKEQANSEKIADRLRAAEQDLVRLRSVEHPQALALIIQGEREVEALRTRHANSLDRLTDRESSLGKAQRDSARITEDVSVAWRTFSEAQEAATSSASGLSGALSQVGSSMGGLARGGPAGIAVLVGIGGAAVELAGVAASAAQSLWLLPAAAGAAAAGIGTVALATMGFGDAIKNIRDPEKFAESLRQLSPGAQQAALAIQNLLPQFDQLQRATSDAFFGNFGQELPQLVNQFLPAIQNMTTGIASAMNSAFQGVFDQLMTPETQQALGTTMDNIVTGFRALAPAAAPVAKALADIAAVGSDFLPELAQEATNAARAFSQFISEKSASGELRQWLSEGLDTVKELVKGAVALGEAFMALAPIGRLVLPDIVKLLESIKTVIPLISATALMVGPSFGAWSVTLIPAVKLIGLAADGIAFISGDAQRIAEGKLTSARIEAALQGLGGGGTSDRSLDQLGINRTTLTPGGGLFSTPSAAPGWGLGGLDNRSGWNPQAAWQEQFKESQKAANGPEAKPTFDPSLWRVDPDFSKVAPGADLNGVFGAAEQASEANLRLLELKKQENVSQSSLIAAENNVLQAKRRLDEEQMATWKSMEKNAKQYSDGMKDIGVALDNDLGISDGLAGMAENLVKFVGSLAAAPLEAQLQAITDADPIKGGFGLLGIMGAQNIAAGKTPLGLGTLPLASNMGPAGLQPGGAYPGDAALLANVPAGRYDASGDLSQGLGDCSSAVEDLVNIMDGRPTGGRGMSTGNAAEWLTQHGFMPGSMPGAFNVGFDSGHMQATLPGGTPFNWGSDAAAARGGVGGTGAFDPAFTSHYYRPVGGTGGPVGMPGGGGYSSASLGGGSIPLPLPVTIVGAGPLQGGLSSLASAVGGGGSASGGGGGQDWLAQQLMANGLSADQTRGILAMNQVEGGAADPKSLLGFTESQAQGPQAHVDAFMRQWNDPSRRGPGGSIPGVGPNGSVSDWNQYMTWIREKIVGQTGVASDWQGNAQPPAQDYQNRLMAALGTPSVPSSPSLAPSTADLYSPANTNPGLNNPAAPGWGGPGIPAGVTAGGGQGPVLGANPAGPGLGAAASAGGAGASMLPSVTGGMAPPAGPGGGGGGIGLTPGGSIDSALGMAASAADLFAPGAGQAAQIGIKLANRAIQYGGQVAGIATNGLMETFLPAGSPLGNIGNSWFGKAIGGLAGAKPALPNIAGQAPGVGGQPGQGQGQGQPGAPVTNNLTVNNQGGTPDQTGQDLTRHLDNMYSTPGPRSGPGPRP